MENGHNEPTKQGLVEAPSQKDLRQLKSIQYLFLAAAILCPISIFLGLPFSLAATACAIIAFVKLIGLNKKTGAIKAAAERLLTTGIVCLCISVIILILNILAFAIMLPTILEAVQTGDYSALDQEIFSTEGLLSEDSSSDGSGKGSKTWG